MPSINVLIGIPGCGKSTFAESGEISGVVVSSDKIRKKYWTEEDQSHNGEVFDIMREITSSLLDDGKDVIIDATNLRREWRKWCIDMAHEKGVQVNAYTFENMDINTCLEQNQKRDRHVPEDVIKRMESQLESPTRKEGFDKIIYAV